MATLTLIRGLPGSGKSTLARDLNVWENTRHIEADMYFTAYSGEYLFDASKLKQAHEWCQSQTRQHLYNGRSVIVSNTFTQMWEMQPYIDMVYDSLQVIECHGQFGNIHNVPNEAIERMKNRWEKYVR